MALRRRFSPGLPLSSILFLCLPRASVRSKQRIKPTEHLAVRCKHYRCSAYGFAFQVCYLCFTKGQMNARLHLALASAARHAEIECATTAQAATDATSGGSSSMTAGTMRSVQY